MTHLRNFLCDKLSRPEELKGSCWEVLPQVCVLQTHTRLLLASDKYSVQPQGERRRNSEGVERDCNLKLSVYFQDSQMSTGKRKRSEKNSTGQSAEISS